MAKQHWRAGNMLYPVPAVMVSCARAGERPNIITVAWAGSGHGVHFRAAKPVFPWDSL